MKKLQQQILEELKNPDFPNLDFLYSSEALECAPKILDKLLEKEKEEFQDKLNLENESLSFESLREFSLLEYYYSLLEHYAGVHSDEIIRKIVEDFEPKLVAFGNEVAYSKRYFEMHKYVYQHSSLNSEQQKILEDTLKAYKIRGISLPKDDQETLKDISQSLSKLSQQFSNNILDSRKSFEYIPKDRSQIEEMPEDDIEAAKKRFQEKYITKKATREEDYKKCFEVVQKMWKEEFDLDREFDDNFKNTDIFYIELENEILAFIQMFDFSEKTFLKHPELKGIAEIGNFCIGRLGVLKEWRKKGLGSYLIHYVLKLYAQKGEKTLYIPSAIQNEAYYQKFGFQTISQPKTCGNTQEVWMKCDLLNISPEEYNMYLFDASQSSMMAIMKYCSDSEIRKYFFDARNRFASSGKYDNQEIILKILELRQQKAQILGYKNYAELSLEFKMAESPEQIISLFGEISTKARPKAQNEISEIQEYFGLADIQEWDLSYYARKLKQEKYALDERELKKYFVFENVLQGMFETVKRLYGIEMREVFFHPTTSSQPSPSREKEQATDQTDLALLSSKGEEIQRGGNCGDNIHIYEVYKDGVFLSYFFTDYFHNALKRPGAWANILREKFGKNKRIVVNVCNFQKSSDGKTLLTLGDVETMFHEFGHAIHEMLSVSTYGELTGFHVEWDFVELPSQLLENWCRDRVGMQLFARHFETHDVLPESILYVLEQLETFGNGQFVLKQNEFAMLDMLLHTTQPPKSPEELQSLVDTNHKKNSLFPLPKNYSQHCSFSHIFDGGYAAGYYSYMWAEIIEKEVWKSFKDSGDIFSREISKLFYEKILSAGSTKKASELFRDYFGRDPEIEAFLEEKGLA